MSSKEYYTPVRPPRAAKVSRDTSGRLMNIVAELSVSKSNDDRKRKMEQLKQDFEASDARLMELISGHREQLSLTMESFSKISTKINTSRRGCHDVKEKLSACKKLLECKRDEIRRLWSESVEHREVINMLCGIKELSKVREKVENHLEQEQFFEATELLVSSISLLDGNLAGVEALKDLKSELHILREKLHHVLVQVLHKHLYMSPPDVFLNQTAGASKSKSYEEVFSNRACRVQLPVAGKSYDFSNDANYKHIATILHCVSSLNRLPETVEILKEDRCQRELMAIVRNSSQVMYDIFQNSSYPCAKTIEHSLFSTSNASEEESFLLDLLEAILDQFSYVAVNHQIFLDNLKKIIAADGLDCPCYEMADIFSKLQATLERFIGDYLDLHNKLHSAETQRTAAAFAKVPTVSDISSFFLRKAVSRNKKQVLFKFDGSSHAINMKSYLQEKDSMKEKELHSAEVDQPVLICRPSAKHITIFFKPLKKFISEIELSLGMDPGTHCPLHTFLMDCVKMFLDEVNIETNQLIDKTSLSLNAWRAVTEIEELKAVEAKAPILHSTLTLHSSLKQMVNIINPEVLPDYSNHFIRLMCNILQTYKDLCNAAYKALIYPDSEDEKIFSVSWARDKDISRLLRSLPNWINLQIEDSAVDAHEFEESPQEIHFRNKEESDLLIRNLSFRETISHCEIINDHKKLANLALMHESMEWLASRILIFADSLPACDVQASIPSSLHEKINESEPLYTQTHDASIETITPSVSLGTKGYFRKLAKDFEDLADTCLLVLHLEVRAHCFFFLLPLYKQGSYLSRKDDQEPEPEVNRLNADLSKIDEALAPILQQKKIKYIFEGIGELLATILINCVSNIKKINENGVKKMGRNVFAIQQNLAGITTNREVALDRARQYFDLLNHTFEDILNQIVEEGPQFQEHEYSAVIQLLHNSREGIHEQEPLTSYLEKLRQILDEVAVSV